MLPTREREREREREIFIISADNHRRVLERSRELSIRGGRRTPWQDKWTGKSRECVMGGIMRCRGAFRWCVCMCRLGSEVQSPRVVIDGLWRREGGLDFRLYNI